MELSNMVNEKNTMLSFQVSRKITALIKEEVDAGNFPTKSEFMRYLLLQWFEKNRPEKITAEI